MDFIDNYDHVIPVDYVEPLGKLLTLTWINIYGTRRTNGVYFRIG